MNLLGKILTLLILLSSIVFLFMAIMLGSSYQNWKETAEENKAIAEQQARLRQDAIKASNEKAIELQAEKVARAYKIAQLSSQTKEAQDLYKTKEASLAAAEKLAAELSTAVTNAEKRVKEQDDEIARIRGLNTALVQQISEIRSEVIEQTNRIYVLEGTEQILTDRQKQMLAINAQLTKVLTRNGLDATSLTSQIPPTVSGEVAATEDGVKFTVTVGKDDGLREGHILSVYRGSKYIGSADIVSVKNNRLYATMKPELQSSPVQKGDYVKTEY